jgi:hypothetical protein
MGMIDDLLVLWPGRFDCWHRPTAGVQLGCRAGTRRYVKSLGVSTLLYPGLAQLSSIDVSVSGSSCYAPRIGMANLFEEFRAVVVALGTAHIPYAICGGIAMSIHSRPRATVDIDLLAPPEAIAGLVDALRPEGFVRRERAPARLGQGEVVMHRLTKIVPGDPDVLSLDVIEVRRGMTEDAWRTRITTPWEGQTLTVVSRAGLIGLKRLRGSPQDIADIAALEARE